jgi:hypothetical protein
VSGDRQLKLQIQELLLGLGSCRSDVAEALRRLRVRARPKDSQGCAVALYLKAVLGADERVRSLDVKNRDLEIRVDRPTLFRWTRIVTIPLPEPVREFIVAFDEAVYPDLIRDELADHTSTPGTVAA